MATVDNDIETGFATGKVVLTVLAVIVFAFAISLFIRGGFQAAVGQQVQAKVYDAAPNQALAAVEAAQKDVLEGRVRWVDPEQGVVAMPIERAMARIVEENQGE